ncbi:glycosyltransferase family 4 protein [Sulfitobacter pseudonitzschiae]|uniref:Glycosyltransferase family 4 protein n=1 Tax=Pseudosulfitobacter pseudonitzschiae TaxID=1402135 RepID=A0A9Q2RXM6_9RHOB|nr:glycosyltransferase family 4 protein [Pseudosulfitobacter pseudonitzschiae]MBM2295140.1 glycosyltransferase family 4 protein [Pseudosulfitobacter pseudonitzschiae]MBM2300055.1 glycosyltransferase family 4 protein [Pseudosulfitobacter pseudonitzschiae]MBM2304973.1 glycosyltransferase family 4 protein [Pseudosulfitobacter pseudonitzschiae]MBM2314751.1 glycosyltransferase family 4 protein [Pseudosulfitobacter pseudonitzschiae]MBM2319662.1 glycosyltransferase family 4 protein [Pseudosulfitobact
MRIAVVNTQVPFIKGGAELHASNLCKALEEHGHDVVQVLIPFKWYPGSTLVDNIMAARLLDLSESTGTPIDLMVGLRFPAYLAQHQNKVFWIIHQYRSAYDMWDSGHSDLLQQPDGTALREFIREEDLNAFKKTQHPIYSNSQNVAKRLLKYTQQISTPLYHPPPNHESLQQGGFGDYLFAPSRLTPGKRQDLILEALAETRDSIRIVFAGVPDTRAYFDQLRQKAYDLNIEDRITWLGEVSDAELIKCYAESRAVIFIPQDEDYGYITLEAMLSGKPVITSTDAGGPLEFIQHESEGLISKPTPKDLAHNFSRIMQDKNLAETMGASAHKRYMSMNINWDHVVSTLTGRTGD